MALTDLIPGFWAVLIALRVQCCRQIVYRLDTLLPRGGEIRHSNLSLPAWCVKFLNLLCRAIPTSVCFVLSVVYMRCGVYFAARWDARCRRRNRRADAEFFKGLQLHAVLRETYLLLQFCAAWDAAGDAGAPKNVSPALPWLSQVCENRVLPAIFDSHCQTCLLPQFSAALRAKFEQWLSDESFKRDNRVTTDLQSRNAH